MRQAKALFEELPRRFQLGDLRHAAAAVFGGRQPAGDAGGRHRPGGQDRIDHLRQRDPRHAVVVREQRARHRGQRRAGFGAVQQVHVLLLEVRSISENLSETRVSSCTIAGRTPPVAALLVCMRAIAWRHESVDACALLCCMAAGLAAASNIETFQGDWKLLLGVQDGKPLLGKELEARLSISGDHFSVQGPVSWPLLSGTLKLDETANPKTVDL